MKHKNRNKRGFFEFLREVLFASQAEREFYKNNEEALKKAAEKMWDSGYFRDLKDTIGNLKSAMPEDREKALKLVREAYVPLVERMKYSHAITNFVSNQFSRISEEDRARIISPTLNEREKAISLAPGWKPYKSNLSSALRNKRTFVTYKGSQQRSL